MKVEKFEDLIAWQKARELTKAIYEVTRSEPFSSDFALRDQIRRAAVSIMSNIAEGFEREGRSEFHRYLTIARASAAEVRSQIYVAADVGYIHPEIMIDFLNKITEVSRIISGLRRAVRRQRDAQK